MALRILKASDPLIIEQIVLVVYSVPGLGKSTLGFSADKPILFDFDKGAHRAAYRGDSVQVSSWQDVVNITPDDITPFNTIVVDTAGRALDFLSADIIRKNAKMGSGGALTLKGFGALKSEFTAWLTSMRMIGKDVVLIAHSTEDKKGDELIERLDIQGGSKGEIYKSSDAMGRLYMANGKRMLSFSPTDAAFGKNPGNFEPFVVPNIDGPSHFLGDIIAKIKERLNELTEAQRERQGIISDWAAKFDELTTAEEFTSQIDVMKKTPPEIAQTVKGMLHKKATESGFVFDKSQNAYVVAQ